MVETVLKLYSAQTTILIFVNLQQQVLTLFLI